MERPEPFSTFRAPAKPTPYEILAQLREGNERFARGECTHPHGGLERIGLAATESQNDHAIATILTCSDSRVPPEFLFDTGIMDLFVVRVAGNVCNTDEAGSIEYGLAHVKTPVLVVLGHTQCGAVTAVAQACLGNAPPLERNIPPLVETVGTAVQRAAARYPDLEAEALIPHAVEENIWHAFENLFLASPATRALIRKGAVKALGAIYVLETGKVDWLPEAPVARLLAEADCSPARAVEPMA